MSGARRIRTAAVAAWLAALLAAAGCARVPPPDLSPEPGALLEQVRASQERVTGCRGSARVSVSSPQASGSLDAWIAAARPDRVRLELLDFFGNTALVLVAGGGRFALYDARSGTLYRGEDTPDNLRRLLPVPIDAPALSSLVCGSVPLVAPQTARAWAGDGVMNLELTAPAARQALRIGPEATVRSATVTPLTGSGSPWSVAFHVFRHRAGAFVPTDAELEGEGASVSLHWKEDREVNPPPEEGLFRLDPPRGAQVVDLPAGSAPPPVELPFRSAQGR